MTLKGPRYIQQQTTDAKNFYDDDYIYMSESVCLIKKKKYYCDK